MKVMAVPCSSHLPKDGTEEKCGDGWQQEKLPCAVLGMGEPWEWSSNSWLTPHEPQ